MTRLLFIQTSFLTLTLAISSCNGQIKTDPPNNKVIVTKTDLGGQPKLVKTLGTNEYANIYCSLKDRSGNLWFGTAGEGAYCYDGKLFTQYTVKEGLSNDIVYAVAEDEAGNIWFGTADGACFFDGTKFNAVPITMINPGNSYRKTTIDRYGLPHPEENAVWSIMQDKRGMLWLGTYNGVYCYENKLFTRFLDKKGIVNKDGLHLKMIDCMLEDKNGNI